MIGLLSLVAAVALSFGQPGTAVDVEAEARAIDAMLIAPCCFTQQVSVHPSPAAEDVRRDVRARLAAGQTRQQILDTYLARYGTRILAAPPARGFAVMTASTRSCAPRPCASITWASDFPLRSSVRRSLLSTPSVVAAMSTSDPPAAPTPHHTHAPVPLRCPLCSPA